LADGNALGKTNNPEECPVISPVFFANVWFIIGIVTGMISEPE